jgi:hypothetical protein
LRRSQSWGHAADAPGSARDVAEVGYVHRFLAGVYLGTGIICLWAAVTLRTQVILLYLVAGLNNLASSSYGCSDHCSESARSGCRFGIEVTLIGLLRGEIEDSRDSRSARRPSSLSRSIARRACAIVPEPPGDPPGAPARTRGPAWASRAAASAGTGPSGIAAHGRDSSDGQRRTNSASDAWLQYLVGLGTGLAATASGVRITIKVPVG